ncbi:hypothetical protein [Sinorhizobium saheli]|uniref:hypothetical protein n=1 Tax=Sinorhizobium saheli TaxID=36856 RepID=UPI000AAD9B4D|nr:hypothetical protein [Sinorhizobium saheli]MQW86121.1 hypothetical protein [Sinorhizobium saheli]
MKTAWKFLVELASRRRPSAVDENSTGHGAEPEPLESEAEHTPVRPFDNSTEAPSEAGNPANQSSLAVDKEDDAADATQPTDLPNGEIETAARDAAPPLPTEAADVAPQGKQSKEFLTKTGVERRERKQRPRAGAKRGGFADKDQHVESSRSGDAFLNDVAILDKEIQELRTLLAQKLHLQNRQLKRMLERFDLR